MAPCAAAQYLPRRKELCVGGAAQNVGAEEKAEQVPECHTQIAHQHMGGTRGGVRSRSQMIHLDIDFVYALRTLNYLHFERHRRHTDGLTHHQRLSLSIRRHHLQLRRVLQTRLDSHIDTQRIAIKNHVQFVALIIQSLQTHLRPRQEFKVHAQIVVMDSDARISKDKLLQKSARTRDEVDCPAARRNLGPDIEW